MTITGWEWEGKHYPAEETPEGFQAGDLRAATLEELQGYRTHYPAEFEAGPFRYQLSSNIIGEALYRPVSHDWMPVLVVPRDQGQVHGGLALLNRLRVVLDNHIVAAKWGLTGHTYRLQAALEALVNYNQERILSRTLVSQLTQACADKVTIGRYGWAKQQIADQPGPFGYVVTCDHKQVRLEDLGLP